MPDLPFIKKKIGLSYLIWLQKSNKYFLLEEPAWFVFHKTAHNCPSSAIAVACTNRYGTLEKESLAFVRDIQSKMEHMYQPTDTKTQSAEIINELTSYSIEPYACYHYQFGGALIRFSYESALFESYLHPLMSHLTTSDCGNDLPLFELFAHDDQIVFRMNGQVKGVWGYDETNLVKGIVFMNLINVLYDKTEDDWLMTVHASAVTNEKETILISASPGSGKTTMAALLQNLGYRLVSDDFVPIDKQTLSAWPFPIAMSIKQGAVKVLSSIYPDLAQIPVNHITSEKRAQYIFPENASNAPSAAYPVKTFIFIQYDPSIDFKWEKLDQAKAVKLLLDQSWISPTNGTAEILLDQITRWSFYRLTYSNNQKALDRIVKLFSHD